MVSIEQWRRAIGLFCGRGPKLSAQSDTISEGFFSDPWTVYNRSLFLCAIVLWGAVAVVTHHPHVNTLLLCNDVETNPGPSMEEQMATITNMLNTKFNEMKTEMEMMRTSITDLQSAIGDMRDGFTALKDHVTELERRQDTMQQDIDATYESTCGLQERVVLLEDLIEKQERYSRRENIILFGMKEGPNEDYGGMRTKVTELFNRCVKDKVWHNNDVLRAHRLGKPNRDKPRPVIVRFVNFMDKLTVLKARDELKNVSIGLSNDLTINQREELSKLRANGQNGYFKNGKLVISPLSSNTPMDVPASQEQRSYVTAARRGGRRRP